MRNIWFQAIDVEAILARSKTDTIRKPGSPHKAGDVVRASVGPRPHFALLRITAAEPVRLRDLPIERRRRTAQLHPGYKQLCRLHFELIAPS